MNVISLLTPKGQVAYLYEDCTIRQGMERMRSKGYTALPVLARDGTYAGTVSEGDFLWKLMEGGSRSPQECERLPLKAVIRQDFNPPVSIRVTMDDLLEQAMHQSFIPVVDDRGAFIGIVTRQSIMRRMTFPMSRRKLKAEEMAAASV